MTLPPVLNSGLSLTKLTADSRQVSGGSVFVAYPGEAKDGRDYIKQAVKQGASAVLWEQENFAWDASLKVANQGIRNLKQKIGDIASEFYGSPSQKLWMIGVTGTNGKTTCSHWLAQAFNQLNQKVAVVGTLGNGVLDAGAPLSTTLNTTPDPILLHAMLADYVQQQAKVVAMEVSSHGLDQGRVNGVQFDVAVFTNLTRDHLDYHGDMAAYAAAKKKLFDWNDLKHVVLNIDDAFGSQLAEEFKAKNKAVMTYGFSGNADVYAEQLRMTEQGITMQVNTPFGLAHLTAEVLGEFNAYNLLAVLTTLLVSDVGLQDAVNAVSKVKPVAGRMQQYGGGKMPLVVIDYAHTPDALAQVLKSLRPQTKGKLTCVFGCGGDRDQGKRPLMAKVSSDLADHVVITSDNPRNESPALIIEAVVSGAGSNAKVIEDRAQAIVLSIKQAHAGDVVLVAGKGHENYQEIAGVKYPFSDVDVVKSALEEMAA
ncbi:MAG: UDP-N-acetylmuramoyl-L-alanyl-D-glutamate:meso-diaminopimelate ligase [Pseudomonadota bacterium]